MKVKEYREAWRVSLHGGHSGQFCDHAEGSLLDILQAANAKGYHTFGVTEHMPRTQAYIYPEEAAMGWTAEYLQQLFDAYILELNRLQQEFSGQMHILRGFEAEVVPPDSWLPWVQNLRSARLAGNQPAFDYLVGSVHFVNGFQIDGSLQAWQLAVEEHGGTEPLAIAYYNMLEEMVTTLRPEVTGHFDLIKKNPMRHNLEADKLHAPAVRKASTRALQAVKEAGSILDLNLAGWRKKLGEPYPSPELVQEASAMRIPFCFGDDSHRPSEAGENLDKGREYLLSLGVNTISSLNQTTISLL